MFAMILYVTNENETVGFMKSAYHFHLHKRCSVSQRESHSRRPLNIHQSPFYSNNYNTLSSLDLHHQPSPRVQLQNQHSSEELRRERSHSRIGKGYMFQKAKDKLSSKKKDFNKKEQYTMEPTIQASIYPPWLQLSHARPLSNQISHSSSSVSF